MDEEVDFFPRLSVQQYIVRIAPSGYLLDSDTLSAEQTNAIKFLDL